MIHIDSKLTKSKLSEVEPSDIQPNATDLKVGKIFKISSNEFLLDEEQKIHRGSVEIQPQEDGYFDLTPGSYEVIMKNKISVAEGEAGWVITRSTLNRNGVFLTSGLYDSGYNGVMAGVMHVTTGDFKIKPGTRIGQYLNFKAQTLKMYDGSYGDDKEHDKKYG